MEPPAPQLLVELPPWPQVFAENLRDLVSPPRLRQLELRSAPAAYWPDVFVKRELPWSGFLKSIGCHVLAFVLLVFFTRLMERQPRVIAKPTFNRSEVVYYQPSEYLPAIDTRKAEPSQASKADPEFSKQPIISVPKEADNRSQTIVTPPKVKLRRDVALPNIVAWSDKEKPQLEIPAAPMTPAADISRVAPQMNSVVKPPPDAARLTRSRMSPALRDSVVAPPPELRASKSATNFAAPQPAVIAAPPSVEAASSRILGDLNIGHSAVIAPAPDLPVGEQRAVSGGRADAVRGVAPQVVPPPPSVGTSETSGGSAGSQGRAIALNLHPELAAPPDPPAGNRRGTFAATAEGHAGASGAPGTASGTGNAGAVPANGRDDGRGSGSSRKSDLPSGLYVGNTAPKTSPVGGDPSGAKTNSVNPNLIANVRPPRVNAVPSRPMQAGDTAKLSEAERAVFGNRRFYSVTLNMPNLNSAGGSWVIRFAEIAHASDRKDANAAPDEISQPAATRKVDPGYPTQLMRENVSGTVILYAVIHADGSVGNVRVLRGVDERLDLLASKAIAQWQFQPALKQGVPVDVEATFQIPFRPAKMGSNF